jgi:hypothetical protein
MACSTRNDWPEKPKDFHVSYTWSNGHGVHPMYQYQYTIEITPDLQGRIAFSVPGYSEKDSSEPQQTWPETFSVSAQDVDRLFQRMSAAGVFSMAGKPILTTRAGGGTESLRVEGNGRAIAIPETSIGDLPEAVNEVYRAIRGIVPPDVWPRLAAVSHRPVSPG